jgi:hypothetical protein
MGDVVAHSQSEKTNVESSHAQANKHGVEGSHSPFLLAFILWMIFVTDAP